VKPPTAVRPDAPTAEQVTTVTPRRNVLPELGAQVRIGLPELASLAYAAKLTVAPEALVASTEILPGRLSVGGLLLHGMVPRGTDGPPSGHTLATLRMEIPALDAAPARATSVVSANAGEGTPSVTTIIVKSAARTHSKHAVVNVIWVSPCTRERIQRMRQGHSIADRSR
jgi:hypothetical protein